MYDLINIHEDPFGVTTDLFLLYFDEIKSYFMDLFGKTRPDNIWTILCKNDHCAAKAVALLYSWPC